ncbi:hypothetical protein [Bacillus pseudomycoides]|uniref:hypothetical protein n=1 Tax=Bacillus pseudomycoides TaxID=64104 RepID=UPI0015D4A053|nr:hypothetical protein [Bacillus pseudomycoides]
MGVLQNFSLMAMGWYPKDKLYLSNNKRGGNNMEITMAVLSFLGGVLPLVSELLKAVM